MATRSLFLTMAALAIYLVASPAVADFSDNFLYTNPPAPLAGHGQWLPNTPAPATSRIRVNGAPQEGINVWADTMHSPDADNAYVNVSENGKVHFTVDIKGMALTNNAYDWWALNLLSDTGLIVGRWTGRSDQFTTWGGTGWHNSPLVLQSQLPLEADIDFAAGTIAYSYNHATVYNDTFSGLGAGIAKIEFVSQNFPGIETISAEGVYFNKLEISTVPEPSSWGLLLVVAASFLGIKFSRRAKM